MRATLPTCGWALCCLALALGSCGGKVQPAQPSSAQPSSAQSSSEEALSDIVRSPERLGEDFVWRQRLTATYGDESFSFQAVVEKTGNTLNLLCLTPYGSRALLLKQRGTTVKTQYFVEQRLPFPARYILSDLHRVYTPTREAPPKPTELDRESTLEMRLDGEQFVDQFVDGRIVRREIYGPMARSDRPDVVVLYADAGGTPSSATRITLDNRAYGYHIEIETLR